MISRREDIKQQSSIDICSRKTDKFTLLPISNTLKSQDCADDLVALTDKITIEAISTPILKIDRHEKQSDDRKLSTKIGYCPIMKNILETSCDDKSRNRPLIFIKCAATPFEDRAGDIRYSTNTDVSCQKSKMTSSPYRGFVCPYQKINIFSKI